MEKRRDKEAKRLQRKMEKQNSTGEEAIESDFDIDAEDAPAAALASADAHIATD
ncbi:MAG: hypothetical protein ACK5AZ_23240 [Bryobacteraceae bacterium]